MKKISFTLCLSIFLLLFISCNKSENSINEKDNIEKITKSFKKWWVYHKNNVDFESDFVAFNTDKSKISKDEFYSIILSKNVIPIYNDISGREPSLTLFKIDISNSEINKNIIETVRQEAKKAYYYYNLEGKPFPNFQFTDLSKQNYNNENTKNKTIILKTWFINCKACIAEFPELNKLVDEYANNDKILFISLALDKSKPLEKFISETIFKYKVIPDQRPFITETLKLYTYPTHIIVNEKGIIEKVGSINQVYRYLDKNISNATFNSPPPPSLN